MRVFREALNNSRFRPEPKLPTEFLMTLLMFVLTCNLFVFDSSFWLQIYGTAMGTRVAPTFACIFMGWLETGMLAAWMGTKVHMWSRFIDDIFFIWKGSEEELNEFIEHCNNYHPTIKFTFEYCTTSTQGLSTSSRHSHLDRQQWLHSDRPLPKTRQGLPAAAPQQRPPLTHLQKPSPLHLLQVEKIV